MLYLLNNSTDAGTSTGLQRQKHEDIIFLILIKKYNVGLTLCFKIRKVFLYFPRLWHFFTHLLDYIIANFVL